jgi:hypothetical protein
MKSQVGSRKQHGETPGGGFEPKFFAAQNAARRAFVGAEPWHLKAI